MYGVEIPVQIVDIETAFLYGDLDEEIYNEEIYMKMLNGIQAILEEDDDSDDCLVLDKSLYGLVQAAIQFFKK